LRPRDRKCSAPAPVSGQPCGRRGTLSGKKDGVDIDDPGSGELRGGDNLRDPLSDRVSARPRVLTFKISLAVRTATESCRNDADPLMSNSGTCGDTERVG